MTWLFVNIPLVSLQLSELIWCVYKWQKGSGSDKFFFIQSENIFVYIFSLLMTGVWPRPLSWSRTEPPWPRSWQTPHPKSRKAPVSKPHLLRSVFSQRDSLQVSVLCPSDVIGGPACSLRALREENDRIRNMRFSFYYFDLYSIPFSPQT